MNKKRGVSEIVSYVLLVIIAVSISVFVFAFLKLYVPKEKPECKEGINLIIESVDCKYNPATPINETKLTLKIQNRGRFNIDASYIRIGRIGRTYRENVISDVIFTPALEPGQTIPAHDSENNPIEFDLTDFGTRDEAAPPNYQLVLEVQPGFLTGRGIDSLALCNKISQTITCTPA